MFSSQYSTREILWEQVAGPEKIFLTQAGFMAWIAYEHFFDMLPRWHFLEGSNALSKPMRNQGLVSDMGWLSPKWDKLLSPNPSNRYYSVPQEFSLHQKRALLVITRISWHFVVHSERRPPKHETRRAQPWASIMLINEHQQESQKWAHCRDSLGLSSAGWVFSRVEVVGKKNNELLKNRWNICWKSIMKYLLLWVPFLNHLFQSQLVHQSPCTAPDILELCKICPWADKIHSVAFGRVCRRWCSC